MFCTHRLWCQTFAKLAWQTRFLQKEIQRRVGLAPLSSLWMPRGKQGTSDYFTFNQTTLKLVFTSKKRFRRIGSRLRARTFFRSEPPTFDDNEKKKKSFIKIVRPLHFRSKLTVDKKIARLSVSCQNEACCYADLTVVGPTPGLFNYIIVTVKLFTSIIYTLGISKRYFRIYDKLCLLSGLI